MVSPPKQPSFAAPTFSTQTEADKHYLRRALLVRSASDDPKARDVIQSGVGAIIATPCKEIVASANVLPPRLKAAYEARGESVTEKDRYFLIEHAERAALFAAWRAGEDLTNATMYGTRFPCSDCARAIVWSKITRLVVPRGFKGEVRWIEAQRAALRILRSGGVVVRYLPIDDDWQPIY